MSDALVYELEQSTKLREIFMKQGGAGSNPASPPSMQSATYQTSEVQDAPLMPCEAGQPATTATETNGSDELPPSEPGAFSMAESDPTRMSVTALQVARSLTAMGLTIIPVQRQTKKPLERNWQNSAGVPASDLGQFWGGPTPCNIGVLLRDGVADIDGDWAAFNAFIDVLLPGLPVYGRPGAPRSHRLLRLTGAPSTTRKFALPSVMSGDERLPKDHQLCIGELRLSGQSVVAPGIHQSGESIEWEGGLPSVLPVLEYADVDRAVRLAAFGAVMTQLFPAVGVRCDLMMAVAGALAHASVDHATIQTVVQLIGHLNGDEGTSGRWTVAAARGLDRVKSDQEVTGLPTVGKILNLQPAVIDFLGSLLGLAQVSDDPDLVALNEEHAVVIVGGKTRILKEVSSTVHPGCTEHVFQHFDDFAHAYSNRWKILVGHGGKPERMPLAKWWHTHPKRRQYLGGIAYMPEENAHDSGDVLNLWTGFSVTPAKGDCDLFLRHIRDVLCSGVEEHCDYMIKWMASIVQKRCRTGIAVLLRSDEEGTGKGFFAEAFGSVFGQHYQQINNPEQMLGKFNDHLQRLSLINADEAFFAKDPRHRNALFGLITERKFNVEPKGCGVFEAVNHLNFIITTNARHAIPVGPTARRFFALNVSNAHVGDTAYFDAMEDELKSGGYQALLYHLLHEVDLAGFDVRKVPKTAALQEQAAHSRKGIDALIETVAHNAWLPHQHARHPHVASTKGDLRGDGFWGWARQNFPELARCSPHSFARDLRPWGCTNWNSGGPHIRFPEDIAELRHLFDQRHGTQDWSGDPVQWGQDHGRALQSEALQSQNQDGMPF